MLSLGLPQEFKVCSTVVHYWATHPPHYLDYFSPPHSMKSWKDPTIILCTSLTDL